jgi:hypothetical protein
VCDIDGEVDLARTSNSANVSRQLSNTLEPGVTVSKQQRSLWSDGVGAVEPIGRDCLCWCVFESVIRRLWSAGHYPK